MVNSEAKKFEIHRREVLSKQHSHIAYVPNHITLKDGVEFTLRGLLRHRENPERMREVYYLAGLMECLMKVEQPVLRTALVRTYYQTVLDLKERLGVNWHGKSQYFLFPLFPMHYDLNSFFQGSLQGGDTQGALRENQRRRGGAISHPWQRVRVLHSPDKTLAGRIDANKDGRGSRFLTVDNPLY